MPGVGIAVEQSNGRIHVQCYDGEQVWVNDKHSITYQYNDGRIINYSANENIPHKILERLQQILKMFPMPNAKATPSFW